MEIHKKSLEEICLETGLKSDQFLLVWLTGLNGNKILTSFKNAGFNNLTAVSDDSAILSQDFSTQIKCWFSTSVMTHLPDGMYSFVIRIINNECAKIPIRDILDEMVRLTDTGGFIALLLQNAVKKLETPSGTHQPVQDLLVNYSWLSDEFGAENAYIMDSSILLVKKIIKEDSNKAPLTEVNIVCPFLGKKDGLGEYVAVLSKRFQSRNVKVNLYKSFENVNLSIPTVLEYERNMVIDLPSASNIVVECHSIPVDSRLARNLEGKILLLRQNVETMDLYRGSIFERVITIFYIFKNDPFRHAITFLRIALRRLSCVFNRLPAAQYRFTKYYLMPHINYSENSEMPPERTIGNARSICIGTFGFAAPYKRVEKICKLSSRLGVHAKILLSISDTNEKYRKRTSKHARRISKKCFSPGVDIETGYFTQEELISKLSSCSHFLFAQVNIIQSSGSMRFGPLLGIPVISTDCFQAADAQAYIVDGLGKISMDYLEKVRLPNRPADGFHYLYSILARSTSKKN